MEVAIGIFIVLLGLHLIGASHSHSRNRRRGANIGWSLARGWYGSFRLFGGTYRHRL
jgi:hypothetical protein